MTSVRTGTNQYNVPVHRYALTRKRTGRTDWAEALEGVPVNGAPAGACSASRNASTSPTTLTTRPLFLAADPRWHRTADPMPRSLFAARDAARWREYPASCPEKAPDLRARPLASGVATDPTNLKEKAMTTPATRTRYYDPEAQPERSDLLGEIAFNQGGGVAFYAEHWTGRPLPSLRVTRTSRTGAKSGFSISPVHREALQRAVVAWVALCAGGEPNARPGATSRESRERQADARVAADRRGGR